jgi:hypothetical protein
LIGRIEEHGACALPDAVDLAERHLTSRLELLRAIREPLRALYNTLTPEQRMALEPGPRGPLSNRSKKLRPGFCTGPDHI